MGNWAVPKVHPSYHIVPHSIRTHSCLLPSKVLFSASQLSSLLPLYLSTPCLCHVIPLPLTLSAFLTWTFPLVIRLLLFFVFPNFLLLLSHVQPPGPGQGRQWKRWGKKGWEEVNEGDVYSQQTGEMNKHTDEQTDKRMWRRACGLVLMLACHITKTELSRLLWKWWAKKKKKGTERRIGSGSGKVLHGIQPARLHTCASCVYACMSVLSFSSLPWYLGSLELLDNAATFVRPMGNCIVTNAYSPSHS